MGGPLPLSPVSLLKMDEENKVRSRVAGNAHMGGGLEKGKRGRPLRLREGVSNRTETASKELLGQAQEWGSTGDLERGGVCEEAPGGQGWGWKLFVLRSMLCPASSKDREGAIGSVEAETIQLESSPHG